MESEANTRTHIYSSTSAIHCEHDICRLIPPLLDWPVINKLDVEPLSGGTTNRIFKLVHPLDPSRSLVIRIYGALNIFTVQQRATETEVYRKLSDSETCPRLIGVFANGRVEQFMNNCVPLRLEQMVEDFVCRGVAKSLAKIHSFQPSSSVLPKPKQPNLWNQLNVWTEHLRDERFEGIDMVKCLECLGELKSRLIGLNDDVVFCHNDLTCGNILYDQRNYKITLIDYEYSGYNYRSFDIAGFFAEAMGGTEDGVLRPHLYPSAEYRHRFCRLYLKHVNGGIERDSQEVNQFVARIEMFGLLTHLYWGFWGLMQSQDSAIDFPYVEYAANRFNQFFQRDAALSSKLL